MNEMDLLAKLRDDVPRTPVSARVEALVLTAMKTHRAERVGVRSARRGISRIGALRPAWRLTVAAGTAVALAGPSVRPGHWVYRKVACGG